MNDDTHLAYEMEESRGSRMGALAADPLHVDKERPLEIVNPLFEKPGLEAEDLFAPTARGN